VSCLAQQYLKHHQHAHKKAGIIPAFFIFSVAEQVHRALTQRLPQLNRAATLPMRQKGLHRWRQQ
jgi:hypothetical protein